MISLGGLGNEHDLLPQMKSSQRLLPIGAELPEASQVPGRVKVIQTKNGRWVSCSAVLEYF